MQFSTIFDEDTETSIGFELTWSESVRGSNALSTRSQPDHWTPVVSNHTAVATAITNSGQLEQIARLMSSASLFSDGETICKLQYI